MKRIRVSIDIELPDSADVTKGQVWEWVAFALDYTGSLENTWLQDKEVGTFVQAMTTSGAEGFSTRNEKL